MPDYLDWPFFEPRHRALAARARRLGGERRRPRPRPRPRRRRRRLPRARRARSATPAGSRHAIAGRAARRRRRRDRHALDLPRARDAGAPRRPGRLRVRDAGPAARARSASPARDAAEGALPAAGRARRGDRRVRALRARRRLRRRGDGVRRAPRRRRLRPRRREDLDLRTAASPTSTSSSRAPPTSDPAEGARGISRLHRRCRHAGLRDRRAHRRDRAASAGAAALHELPHRRERSASAPTARASRSRCARSTSSAPRSPPPRSASPAAPSTRRWRARPRARCSARRLGRLPAHAGQAGADGDRRSTAPRCSPTAPPGSATRAANVTREAAMAKLAATEGAQQVIDAAVQMLGGLGVAERRAGRAALPRDPGAAHLRRRERGAAADHRPRPAQGPRPGQG